MAAQRITAPFATPERSADVLGVSKSRASRLVRWASESQDVSVTKTKVNGSNGKVIARKTASK